MLYSSTSAEASTTKRWEIRFKRMARDRHCVSKDVYTLTLTLKKSIRLKIREVLRDEGFYFQKDGVPPQHHRDVRSYLNELLSNRWIRKRDSVK